MEIEDFFLGDQNWDTSTEFLGRLVSKGHHLAIRAKLTLFGASRPGKLLHH